jgi:Leucine-rich repeat (LRR) protein
VRKNKGLGMGRDQAYQKAEQIIEKARRLGALELDLSYMTLSEVPEALASLTKLQQLDLSNNRLTKLSESIVSLTQLQQLDISRNQLRELPESIAFLTQLQQLNLFNNQITKLPNSIASLTKLQVLNLSHNQITELPNSIASLTKLQVLNLSTNQIIKIPDSIAFLIHLQILDLHSNKLKILPEAIASLTQLQQLNLFYNQLTELPEAFKSLTQLQQLNLFYNQLTELPEAIASLTRLQQLDLSWNLLKKLPENIASLTQLQTLYLSNNQLTELPEAIATLTQLQRLDLSNNPLNPDLAAAYKQGTKAFLQYLHSKAEAQIILNEAKLILIGEGEVGKSCLLRALRGEEWVEGLPTTHGIEIKPVVVIDPDNGTEITLNGWDFGGQRVYRPTHQLFFSAPAVYLVVWKPREGTQQGFVTEWIKLIQHREPQAKVLVVATHGGPGQRQADIDRQEILDQFGSYMVLGFFHIDSKPNKKTKSCKGLAELKQAIGRVAASLPEVGRSVPAKWQRVREILQNSDNAYLTYKDVIAICAEQGIDEEQAELFLRISNTLGHFIYYHYDRTLRDIVILKPDWLAKAISFVLDDEITRKRNGLVEFEHLSQLWGHPPFPGETGYPKVLHPVFRRLMERFDLSYRVVFHPTEDSNTSLIAQLVPDIRPQNLPNWGEQPATGEKQQIQICRIVDDRGQFAVAEGLFYQLIVRLHKYSLGRNNYDNSVHWQRGLMLDNDYNGRALLEYISTDVKITVRAAYPERFLSYLTEEIKWLVENFWEGLRCHVMVPCISPCGKNKPGNGLFEVQQLIKSKRENRDDYPCPICGEWQNIDNLLNNAPTTQPPSQEIGLDQFRNIVKDELNVIRRDLVILDQREQQRYQALSQEQRIILSRVDEEFAALMQTLTDEAKDGPRLFSFKPLEPGFFDKPKWLSAKFQLTLWCEHARQPLPVLNPQNPKKGVYELDLPREWFVKAAPYLKIITGTLSLVLPVAASTTKLILDENTYKGIEEEVDLGLKSIESVSKIGSEANDLINQKRYSLEGEAVRAQGAILRELHTILKEKDSSFGGLIRVQNKRREFLWIHEQFVDEY